MGFLPEPVRYNTPIYLTPNSKNAESLHMQEVCQTILPGKMDTYYKFPEILFGDDTAIVQHRAILEWVCYFYYQISPDGNFGKLGGMGSKPKDV